MSHPDCKVAEQLRTDYVKLRKTLARDGLDENDNKRLNEMQAKVELAQRLCAATAPAGPESPAGPVSYKGIPANLLRSEQDKKNAQARAAYVQKHLKDLQDAASRLETAAKSYNKMRHTYDSAIEGTQAMWGAYEKDKKARFEKLNAKSIQNLDKALRQYEIDTSEVRQQTKRVEAQAWQLAAAQIMVEKAEAQLKVFNLKGERAEQETQKAKYEKELESVRGFVSGFLTLATITDPASKIKSAGEFGVKQGESFLQGLMMSLLTSGVYEKQIKAIEDRIRKIDEQLQQLGADILRNDLNAALAKVSATRNEIGAAREQLNVKKGNQVATVGLLANIEKGNPNTTTIFAAMKKYYDTAQSAGTKMLEASRNYETAMSAVLVEIPFMDEIMDIVSKDGEYTQRAAGSLREAEIMMDLEDVKAIQAYLKETLRWFHTWDFKTDIAAERMFQKSLIDNDHFQAIDQLVNSIQEDQLGHVAENVTK